MTFNEAKEKFQKLFKNEMSKEEAKKFLVELYEKGESAAEIAAAAEVMREHSIKLPVSEELREKLIDIVGTGGDKSNSFNISSTTALLVSSIGSYVAKHGNRSITSKSGSADMLEALGINLNLTPEKQVKMLEEVRFTFIFAINHHPAMKHIMPIRKSLIHRTIFNILGPLTNPAGAKKYLLGVFSPEFIEPVANALTLMDVKSAMVVSSLDGMDEISIAAPTKALYYDGVRLRDMEIRPDAYGMIGKKEDLIGGDAKENAKITRGILSGEIKGAKRDAVLLNAAAALFVDGKVGNIEDGIEMAKEEIESGRAIKHLEKIIEVSNRLA
ncbi:anthranilate phosphoribosyltransferase [Caminibacter pacificus]|uniref:Anthranilate phosphoribosyltransferase n=1 Tax=Caminibacter pacificus TaxID=1424653 RepID=A0AAJ4UYF0_9BACT|nr:anthranilate phosphoribosyltransferase [Caminibacter pacificus]QCI28381.1 anthranilate phosphoribosyltransferase [Caminibacter pacificus]ROR40895.1 anthranilate phosphoribosyltransferase [Caminibacter pacificus]